jgi:hypothetical protein
MSGKSPADVYLRPRIGPVAGPLRQRTAVGSDVFVYFDVVDRLTGTLVPGATGVAGGYWLPATPTGAGPAQPVLLDEPEPGTLRMRVPGQVPGPYTAECYIAAPSRQGARIHWDVAGDGSSVVTGAENIPWNDVLSAAGAMGASAANWAFANLDPRLSMIEALVLYVTPALTLSASPSVLEVGASAPAVTLSLTTSRPDLPVQITGATSRTVPAGQTSILAPGPWSSDATWTAAIADPDAPPGQSDSASAAAGLSFLYRSYRGVSPTPVPDNAAILALPDQQLASGYGPRSDAYDCSGGRYPVLVFPKAWGAPPGQIRLNGFASNAFTVAEKVVTNAAGVAVVCWLLALSTKQNGSNIQVEW